MEDKKHVHTRECDRENHTCYFCGDYVCKEGYEDKGERHFLSDCRPDLVEHEIGDACTWSYRRKAEFQDPKYGGPFKEEDTCYAYQDKDRNWTTEHKHFYPDGPM